MRYQIGDFSRIARLSVKTLRYYHEEGLLMPDHIDPESGYRYYSDFLLERARMIHELRSLEFPLKTIKEILEHHQDDGEFFEFLKVQAIEVERQIGRYQQIRQRIQLAMDQEKLSVTTSIAKEIIVKDVKPLLIASIRYKGAYESVGDYIQTMFCACGRYIAGAPLNLYYDTDYKDGDADMEISVPVRKAVENGEVKSRTLEGGRVLSLTHHGPYETIGESYKAIIDHINSHQLKILSPSREIYLKGPGMILPGNPKRYVTEIQMMIDPQ